MANIRPDFTNYLISSMADDIFYQQSQFYYFLGKLESWDNDLVPPSEPDLSYIEDNNIRDNILYIHKISPNDVSIVANRYDWISGTVYTQWDHTQDLKNSNFYCVTDDYNVYKCLHNNYGSESTIKPSSISFYPFETNDGYIWKYMFNIPSFKRLKFLSNSYIPVQTALSNSFYNKGSVERVSVIDRGSGYSDSPQTYIDITAITTGTSATAEITSVGSLGQITGLNVISGGTGYTSGAKVTINSVTGSGAEIEITETGGVIDGFTIIDGGYAYEVTDTVSITVGGAILTPVISNETGELLNVIIEDSGIGYTSANLSLLPVSPTGLESGKYGNANAVISAILYQGKIVEVLIEDPGVNYTADTATTITVQGDGTGAEFLPVISNGEIIDVVIENSGIDYTYMNLTVVGDGTGAVIEPILASSDFTSDQSIVEQTAIEGAIYSVVVTETGDNYSPETSVSIEGDGTGATAELVIEDGKIVKVNMTSYGSGYTYTNFVFNDPNRVEPNDFTDAEVYSIFPPIGGHGKNAIKELYCNALGLFTLVQGDEELSLLQQDYRQYGILRNVTNVTTNSIIKQNTDYIVYNVLITDVTGLLVDDVLIGNNIRYRVVKIGTDNSTNEVILQKLNNKYIHPTGTLTKETDELSSFNVISINEYPLTNKYSGDLLYIKNTTPFIPDNDKSIAIRTYISI